MVPSETIWWISGVLVVVDGRQWCAMYGLNRFKSYRSDHLIQNLGKKVFMYKSFF